MRQPYHIFSTGASLIFDNFITAYKTNKKNPSQGRIFCSGDAPALQTRSYKDRHHLLPPDTAENS